MPGEHRAPLGVAYAQANSPWSRWAQAGGVHAAVSEEDGLGGRCRRGPFRRVLTGLGGGSDDERNDLDRQWGSRSNPGTSRPPVQGKPGKRVT